MEHPETRQDFKHPDLKEWVLEQQPELLLAALTIPMAYLQAGRPLGRVSPNLAGFEEWSNLVRGALVWCG
jgi:hypothetical protein